MKYTIDNLIELYAKIQERIDKLTEKREKIKTILSSEKPFIKQAENGYVIELVECEVLNTDIEFWKKILNETDLKNIVVTIEKIDTKKAREYASHIPGALKQEIRLVSRRPK